MTTATKSAGSSAPRFKVGDEVWFFGHYGEIFKDSIRSSKFIEDEFCYWVVYHSSSIGESELFATPAELVLNIKKQIEDIEDGRVA